MKVTKNIGLKFEIRKTQHVLFEVDLKIKILRCEHIEIGK